MVSSHFHVSRYSGPGDGWVWQPVNSWSCLTLANNYVLDIFRVGVKYFTQVQVLFHICKYKFKYSEYLEDIKYFFNQVQVLWYCQMVELWTLFEFASLQHLTRNMVVEMNGSIWMNEYLFHRSFQISTSFHMHLYIELDFPYIWFTQVI